MARRLRRARWADSATIEDVIQDVAVRVVERAVPFDDADHLYRWCAVAARRLQIDAYRRVRRLVALGADCEVATGEDLSDRVVHMQQAQALADAVQLLTRDDRDLVLFGRPGRAMTNAETVRRHRLRAQLASAIGGLSGVLAWIRLRLRLRAGTSPAAVALGTTSVMLAVGLSIVPASAPWRTPGLLETAANPPSGSHSATHSEASVHPPSEDDFERPRTDGLVVRPPTLLGHESEGRVEPTGDDDSIVCIGGNPEADSWCYGDPSSPTEPVLPDAPVLHPDRICVERVIYDDRSCDLS